MVAINSAIESYSKGTLHAEVLEASPHRIIQMLMDGFIDRIAYAKGNLERGEMAQKSQYISKAIGIINGLKSSLDVEKGGDIAHNLNDLYDYINRRLILANTKNDMAILHEVSALMKEVKDGWDAIPADYR